MPLRGYWYLAAWHLGLVWGEWTECECYEIYPELFCGLVYLGEWHKHPVGFDAPSNGDEHGCRAILQDPNYRIEGLLLFPIFTMYKEGAVTPFYYHLDTSLHDGAFTPRFDRQANLCAAVREVDATYRSYRDHQAKEMNKATAAVRLRDATAASTPAAMPQWYESAEGAKELTRIREALQRKGWRYSARRLRNGRLTLNIVLDDGLEVGLAFADDQSWTRQRPGSRPEDVASSPTEILSGEIAFSLGFGRPSRRSS